MGKLKPKGSGATTPAAPATATVPALAPVKPAGGAAAGGAAPRKAAPSGGAPRNVPPPPPPPPEEVAPVSSGNRYGGLGGGIQYREGQTARLLAPGYSPEAEMQATTERLRKAESESLAPYIERLSRVREARQRGAAPVLSGLPMAVPTALKGAPKGSGDGRPGRPVYPNYTNVKVPTEAEMQLPVQGAREAKQLADQYRQAHAAYEKQRVVTEAAKADPHMDRAVLLPYAAETRERLQRVADLRASLREYGWSDDDLNVMVGEAPKTEPTPAR